MRAAVDRLLVRVAHWSPARWQQPTGPAGSRADVVSALVQRLADAGAVAEGQPRRPVPRPDHEPVLVDQLRVVVADLLLAGPAEDVLRTAEADLRDTLAAL